MLSFQIIQFPNATGIQVHIDEDGLALLLRQIESARKHGHVHLRTPANGGNDLDEMTPTGSESDGMAGATCWCWCSSLP